MKKGCIISIAIIGIAFFLFLFLYSYAGSHLLEPASPILIKTIEVDKQNKIEILYIPGNATSQNITQIRKINKKTKEKYVLENYYKRYNYLEKFSLEDKKLSIILRDTNIHYFERMDTFQLNIQDVKYKLE
ncbi:hypothetical protein LJC72_13270 [Bacteroides sp. OttesenSCG-928-D19]|nr:hypothetical protein [Bacteroides sp. OttesenSCG-928-D19]